jgi:hypothetical protein
MILADEMAAIEEKLKQQASRKELAFYQRLTGHPLPYPGDDKLMDIEQVCLSALCTGAPNKTDLVERFRRSKPIKGLHYANNLIELAAFAIHDRDSEADHLKSFCSTCSARDHLILNQLFPGVCTLRPSSTRPVDIIATWLDDGSSPDDWKPVFLDALQSANDLLDLYVIRQGYVHLWECHPSTEQRRDLQYLGGQLDRAINRIKVRSNRRFNAIASVAMVAGSAVIAYFSVRRWDVAEPIIWAFTFGIFVAGILMLLLFGRRLEKVYTMLEQTRENRAQAALRKAGLDEETIRKVTTKYIAADADASVQKLTRP